MSINIRRFSTSDSDFDAKLQALLAFETAQDDSVDEVVAQGFDTDATARARQLVESFQAFIQENKDEITALQIR